MINEAKPKRIRKGIPWNKGLTKVDSRISKGVEKLKETIAKGNVVRPPLSEAHKKKLSDSRKKYLDENPDKVPYRMYHSSKMSYPEQFLKMR